MQLDFEDSHSWVPDVYRPLLIEAVDQQLTDHLKQALVSNAFDHICGRWAWIGPDGTVYPVNFASHDWVAYEIFLSTPEQIERTHGRFSSCLFGNEKSCFSHVSKPTKRQIRSYYDLMASF